MIDLAASIEQAQRDADRAIADADATLRRAVAAQGERRAAVERVRGAFTRGAIPEDEYMLLLRRAQADLTDADEHVAEAAANAQALEASPDLGAELADVRRLLLEPARTAATVKELRAAVSRVFDHFQLSPSVPSDLAVPVASHSPYAGMSPLVGGPDRPRVTYPVDVPGGPFWDAHRGEATLYLIPQPRADVRLVEGLLPSQVVELKTDASGTANASVLQAAVLVSWSPIPISAAAAVRQGPSDAPQRPLSPSEALGQGSSRAGEEGRQGPRW